MQTNSGISEQVRAAIEQCTLGISLADAVTLLHNLHADEEACSFNSRLRELLRFCVVSGHRRQLQSFTGLLRVLSGAVVELECTRQKGTILEETIQWLLSLQGGPGQGTRDTSVRWHCCALLTSLVDAAALRGIKLSARLAADTGEAFRVRARDRSADVRLAAVEGLHANLLRAPGALAVASDRANNDCDDLVRAAAVRALLVNSDAVPVAVIARARLDRAVRVRRTLLEAMEVHARSTTSGSSWASAWSTLMLQAVSDRSTAVRITAVQCLQAGVERGWLKELFQDIELVVSSSCRTIIALAMVLHRSVQPQRLQKLLMEPVSEHAAGSSWADGSEVTPRAAALHARVAAGAVMMADSWNNLNVAGSCRGESAGMVDTRDLPLDGSTAAPALMSALEQNDSFQLQQLLHIALVAALPLCEEIRESLTRAASAVLTNAPVSDAVEVLLERGVFPAARLGGSAEEGLHTAFLAMSLLRRIVIDSCQRDSSNKCKHIAAEAWFSRAAAATIRGLMQALRKAHMHVEALSAKVAAAHEKLEDAQWTASSKAKTRVGSSKNEQVKLEKAVKSAAADVTKAQSAVKDAKAIHEERFLRLVLATVAWLSLSQVPLAKDAQQRAVLEVVLRPALEMTTSSGTHEAQALQIAAVFGVAVYASKSPECALSHWPFFLGVLKTQMPQFSCEAATSTGGEGGAQVVPAEELCMAVRLAEVAVLFLCDSLLLHSKALEKVQMTEAFCALAYILAALSKRLGNNDLSPQACHMLWHLRAIICDRVCCLVIKQVLPDDCAAFNWMLGCLLADVCGVGPGQPSFISDIAAAGLTGEGSCGSHSYVAMAPVNSPLTEKAISFCSAEVKESLAMGPAISRSRLLRFFAMLPALSRSHAEILAVSVEAFYSARLWMDAPKLPMGTSLRFVPAVRAACFSCGQLQGRMVSKSHEKLQVRVLRAVAAAFLSAPQKDKSMLGDALAATIITAAHGESALEWVTQHGSDSDVDAAEAISSLLCDWTPSSSAKPLESLSAEVQARSACSATVVATDVGWQWAQSAVDKAADFRHDLAHLGLPAGGSSQRRESRAVVRNAPKRRPNPRRHVDTGNASRADHMIHPAASTELQQPSTLPEIPEEAASNENGQEWSATRHSCDAQHGDDGAVSSGQACDISHGLAHGSAQQEAISHVHYPGAAWVLVDSATEIHHKLRQGSKLMLGRRSECDICLKSTAVSGRHCSILLVEARVELTDLGGTNGTYVNDERIVSGGQKFLQDGDTVVLASLRDGPRFVLMRGQADDLLHHQAEGSGQVPIPVTSSSFSSSAVAVIATASAEASAAADVSAGVAAEPQLIDMASGEIHRLRCEGEFTLGRRRECEVVLTSLQVSGRHCVLRVNGNQVEVRDVSSNGAYKNGVSLPKSGSGPGGQVLQHGDRLTLASADGPAFVFVAAGQPQPSGPRVGRK